MEKIPTHSNNNIEAPHEPDRFNESLAESLGLMVDQENTKMMKFNEESLERLAVLFMPEQSPITPETLASSFEGVPTIESDPILRPNGDTTLFTTSGIQHVETVMRQEGRLERSLFAVAQPSIRSQFLDKTKNGTSTSFVNFTIGLIKSTEEEHADLSESFVKFMVIHGADPARLRFVTEKVDDSWGNRSFTKSVATIYLSGIEVGECVYMNDYPVTPSERIDISDLCFGVERLNFAAGTSRRFFSEFEDVYEKFSSVSDSNRITSVIDCIRTAVLMSGEGVRSAHVDPGYRLRQLIKRFVARNSDIGLNAGELIDISYEGWRKWNVQFPTKLDEVHMVLENEIERSMNVMILSEIEKQTGNRPNCNVNQKTSELLNQIDMSLSKEDQRIAHEYIANRL